MIELLKQAFEEGLKQGHNVAPSFEKWFYHPDKDHRTSLDLPKVHYLKTWPTYFESILMEDKNFEVRKDDRKYKKGDILVLREYRKHTERYTGRYISCEVTYKLTGEGFGIKEGFCVMGISIIRKYG